MDPADIPLIVEMWNNSSNKGEVVYKPLTQNQFINNMIDQIPGNGKAICLVAAENNLVDGFIHGVLQGAYLRNETQENTPVYLTALFVRPGRRGKGIGRTLIKAFIESAQKADKRQILISDRNPVQLSWNIPDTEGHDHNKAPGVDEDCAAYEFLKKCGFMIRAHEVAMHLPLSQYTAAVDLEQKRDTLAKQGIFTGLYNTKLRYNYDRMCDRGKFEYWRKILFDETSKVSPRPILAATHKEHIIGFTGPVDIEPSGRGWFSGICTDPEYEGRGIATVLFNLLMQVFITIGASFSTLFTGKENHAQRLYLRTGFKVVRKFAVMYIDI